MSIVVLADLEGTSSLLRAAVGYPWTLARLDSLDAPVGGFELAPDREEGTGTKDEARNSSFAFGGCTCIATPESRSRSRTVKSAMLTGSGRTLDVFELVDPFPLVPELRVVFPDRREDFDPDPEPEEEEEPGKI